MTAFEKTLRELSPSVKLTWDPHRPDSNYNAVFTDRSQENQV